MIFVDYVTLLLVNMAAGYFILAGYLFRGLDEDDQQKWAPAFGVTGVVALVFGGLMTVTWPLPGPFNMAFGELSVLFGIIFAGAALCLARDWNMDCLAFYALFAGLAAVVIGAYILQNGLTQNPMMAGIGFILSGMGGVFAFPALTWLRSNMTVRMVGAVIMAAAGAIWAFTGYMAYWGHMSSFGPWIPVVSQMVEGG